MGAEVPDACRASECGCAALRSRRIRASDSTPAIQNDKTPKDLKDAFASSRFVCLLPRFSHRCSQLQGEGWIRPNTDFSIVTLRFKRKDGLGMEFPNYHHFALLPGW